MLRMGWGIPEAYQDDCKIFEIIVTDDCETVAMIWMDEELEKETHSIDNRKIALSSYHFDNISL